MSVICLEKAGDNEFFMLPGIIVDRYMLSADETELKLILYLIRNAGQPADSGQLCTLLKMDEDKLENALQFWVRCGVLSKRGGRLTLSVGGAAANKAPQYSGETVRLRAQQDERLQQLYLGFEQISQKTLSSEDMSELFAIYDYLGLPCDVILMIAGYAKSVDKMNMSYVKKLAADWSDRGIDTVAAANDFIMTLEESREAEHRIVKLFGLGGRALTKKEKEYIFRWSMEWGASDELIELAFNEAVDRKGKLSFSYIDGILKSWNGRGVKTAEDVIKEQKNFRKNAVKQEESENKFDMDKHLQMSWDIITK